MKVKCIKNKGYEECLTLGWYYTVINEGFNGYYIKDNSDCLVFFSSDKFELVSTNKVKNPNAKHYELWKDFEAIDIIKATLTEEEYLGYLKGNIIKYKLRDKGQDESDKVKIKDYTNELNNLINK
jgi:hypothetical protein